MTLSANKSIVSLGTRNGSTTAPNSIRLRLPEYATVKWLMKHGFVKRTAYRLIAEPSRIDLITLSKLCDVLNCEPNDILVGDGGKSTRLRRGEG